MISSCTRRLAMIALLSALVAVTAGPPAEADTRVDSLPPELRRAYMIGIQEELLAHGYHVGPIDGLIGKRTKGAIRQYQRDAGLPVNGVATKELLDHLKFAIPKVYARGTIVDPDPLVRDIQTALHDRGYYPGALDGRFGPLTSAAIAAFQGDAGLAIDGQATGGFLEAVRNADPGLRRN